MIFGRVKNRFRYAYHTKFVGLSWALLKMEMCILNSVIKTGCYRADTIVKLAANMTLQAVCGDYHKN